MNKKKIDALLAYCKQLSAEGLTESGDCLSIRDGEGMLITNPDKLVSEQTDDDVKLVKAGDDCGQMAKLHLAIYAARHDVSAVITNHAFYCKIVAKHEKKLVAVLDDMAQIIGRSAKIASGYEPSEVIKTLKGRNACLIKNGGVIATGRTLDEAHTGSLVLEKGAKAYVEGTVLGGAVKIPFLDAVIMRFVYKKKYSKADQNAKAEEAE